MPTGIRFRLDGHASGTKDAKERWATHLADQNSLDTVVGPGGSWYSSLAVGGQPCESRSTEQTYWRVFECRFLVGKLAWFCYVHKDAWCNEVKSWDSSEASVTQTWVKLLSEDVRRREAQDCCLMYML